MNVPSASGSAVSTETPTSGVSGVNGVIYVNGQKLADVTNWRLESQPGGPAAEIIIQAVDVEGEDERLKLIESFRKFSDEMAAAARRLSKNMGVSLELATKALNAARSSGFEDIEDATEIARHRLRNQQHERRFQIRNPGRTIRRNDQCPNHPGVKFKKCPCSRMGRRVFLQQVK